MAKFLPVAIGLALFAVGGLVAWVNFYTSFIQYPLHRWRGGTRADFRGASGFPIVGLMCLLLAAFCLGDHRVLMWSALVVALFDTSGPQWVILALIYTLVRRRKDGA
jgi:hypothetical protein